MTEVRNRRTIEEEWLWGWDPTPGIVSVWADGTGQATVWRRIPETGTLVRETERYEPWVLLATLEDLHHLGNALAREGVDDLSRSRVIYRELKGPGELRYLVRAKDGRTLTSAILDGASRRTGRRITSLNDLDDDSVLVLPPEEQYLVATGRTHFRGLTFDQVQRLQFDLETTGLDAAVDRIFMISVRYPTGETEALEARDATDAAEAEVIRQLLAKVAAADPDAIENHNLHGFDLPFINRRARRLGVPITLGRIGPPGFRQRAAQRGVATDDSRRRVRLVAPGRELIDTMDAVIRYDFSTRSLPSHGLKAVARHLGLAAPDREYIRGAEIYETYRRDPDRVRRYSIADVEEVAGISRMLGGAAFALAQMAPRRYERLSDAGAATGVIDPMLVRAYVHAGHALPAHQGDDGTSHSGAALHLFATGVAHRVVKVDVASLYPSLMRQYRIGPQRDELNALLALVDGLVERRLQAKALGRAAPAGSPERHTHEAMSAAMKIVVNSAYGYLAAGGDMTRFADVHAANEVTRRGREVLELICRALADRGVTLLEADTDGVYFAVPNAWTEADERRVVGEVAALLPSLVQLELEGRYAAMLSHEPKNYALLGYDGTLLLRGVAFRSSRAEPYGEVFLRRALKCLLADDVQGVRDVYVDAVTALRRREFPTRMVASRVRLTKSPARYLESREKRKELPYEAMLMSGRVEWSVGDRVRVYRKKNGEGGVVDPDDDADEAGDPRDYDVEYYARQLRETYAARLARAFTPADFAAVFADPEQLLLMPPSFDRVRTVLTPRKGSES
ncbi:MAG TPA: ribonuclease H-like domain-containing protein [Gemmatimonadaceae bacterium]|jgi:DNA polymerase elongation subunit (family B)|nr:ribonuclease H-like domain-containing protein [Gemmatimonadaceae bacterium]